MNKEELSMYHEMLSTLNMVENHQGHELKPGLRNILKQTIRKATWLNTEEGW